MTIDLLGDDELQAAESLLVHIDFIEYELFFSPTKIEGHAGRQPYF